MKIEKAGAEAFGLAVDDVEDFHLLPFSEADEAHEWEFNRQLSKMTETMLTIDLRQHFARVRRDLKSGASPGPRRLQPSPGPSADAN